MAAYILLYHSCSIPPVSCFRLIIPCVLPAWHHLLYIYVLLYACVHDTIFNTCLWFGFIDTRVFIFAHHLVLASPLAREFWLPWILMSRSWSLEPVNSPSCWPERCSGSVDPQQTVQSPIFLGPLHVSRVFLLWTRERHLYCSCLYISLYSRICAYRWCNILVIFVTSGDNFVIVLICWNV